MEYWVWTDWHIGRYLCITYIFGLALTPRLWLVPPFGSGPTRHKRWQQKRLHDAFRSWLGWFVWVVLKLKIRQIYRYIIINIYAGYTYVYIYRLRLYSPVLSSELFEWIQKGCEMAQPTGLCFEHRLVGQLARRISYIWAFICPGRVCACVSVCVGLSVCERGNKSVAGYNTHTQTLTNWRRSNR